MTQFLPLTAGGLTYVLSYDPSGTPNQKPSFTSTPVTTATEGGLYAYTAVAEDPEDDEITYSLDTYPTGMTICPYTGIIHWAPTSTDTEAVVVRATDSNGAYSTQSFNITVVSFAAAGGVDIDAAWLADTDNGGPSGPYYLDTKNKIYRLQTDVTTDGTAFVIINSGITFNLNGHTITYDNATPIVVTNGSFEAGTGGAATGWDATNGPHCLRAEGVYLSNSVYDGDYAIECTGYTGDEYLESVGTVTLEANTTYGISAMLWTGKTGSTWVSGVSAYASLVGQGGEDTQTAVRNTATDRGIQLTVKTFTTGESGGTYKIRVGAIKPAGATTHKAYIDDVQIHRYKQMGVCVSAHSWAPSRYPDITRYGRASNVTVLNGTLIQGTGNSYSGHSVYSYESNGITTVNGITATVAGHNSCPICGVESFVITDCDLTSNVQTISSRDAFNGTVINAVRDGIILRNTIRNGPDCGIYLSTAGSVVAYNTISLTTKYTNAFAIMNYNAPGSDIHHNTIACGTESYAARGISVNLNTVGNACLVHDNTITVQGTTDNQEYGGAMIGGFYGIQIENCSDVEVYENTVTAIASVTDAAAFRMNVDDYDHGSGVSVHDNKFVAQRTGSGVGAAVMMFENIYSTEVTIENNELETNSMIVSESRVVHDVEVLASSLKVTGDEEDWIALESYNWTFTEGGAITDMKFVDTTYYDATSKTRLVNAPLMNSNGSVDPYSSFIHSFTTTFQVNNSLGQPVSGATVTVVDKDDTLVLEDTTDENGQVVAVIDEFRTTGDVKTSYSPYTASAVSGELSGGEEFTADQIQTITITVT